MTLIAKAMKLAQANSTCPYIEGSKASQSKQPFHVAHPIKHCPTGCALNHDAQEQQIIDQLSLRKLNVPLTIVLMRILLAVSNGELAYWPGHHS